MVQVNMHEAKTHLSRLVERAAAGEEIIIARAGKPVAQLITPSVKVSKQRLPGMLKGKLYIADDAFAPMTEEELDLWYK